MRILVLQHAACEHPGFFRGLLEEDGHDWVPVEMDAGETPPHLDGFDALWVMGGPQDTWEEDKYPWLSAEKDLIRHAIAERGMPFLGLCLGHQLMACALGGDCGPSKTPEIGVLDVILTEEGVASTLFDGVDSPLKTLQWHSAEVNSLPDGATILATTPDCVVQAMAWGPRAFGMQFHMEVEADTCANWAEIPAYAGALEKALGPNGLPDITAACDAQMASFNKNAERVYINWLQAAAKT